MARLAQTRREGRAARERGPGRRWIARIGPFLLVTGLAFLTLVAPPSEAAAQRPYRLLYVDGHMHTVESDGSGTIEDVKDAALARGLSAIIVTNHTAMLTNAEWARLNQKARELSDRGFLVLNAFEVTGSEGLFLRDHVLAWGVEDPFVGDDAEELSPEEVWPSPFNPDGTGPLYPENIATWVDYIHRQGGIAVHAHTTGSTAPEYDVDLIELFNMSHVKSIAAQAAALGLPASDALGLALTLNNMAIYGERDLSMPVELPGVPVPLPLRDALILVTGQVLGAPEAPLHSWDELLMRYVRGEADRPTFGVANSDAHNTANIPPALFEDDSDVGEAKTGVLVRTLSPRSLLGAIEAGRCFATTGPSLRFTVNGSMMGETSVVGTPSRPDALLRLSVDSESPTALIAKVAVVKNGEVLESWSPMTPDWGMTLRDVARTDGYYRVEVVSVDVTTGAYRFAYSNPVFVVARTH